MKRYCAIGGWRGTATGVRAVVTLRATVGWAAAWLGFNDGVDAWVQAGVTTTREQPTATYFEYHRKRQYQETIRVQPQDTPTGLTLQRKLLRWYALYNTAGVPSVQRTVPLALPLPNLYCALELFPGAAAAATFSNVEVLTPKGWQPYIAGPAHTTNPNTKIVTVPGSNNYTLTGTN